MESECLVNQSVCIQTSNPPSVLEIKCIYIYMHIYFKAFNEFIFVGITHIFKAVWCARSDSAGDREIAFYRERKKCFLNSNTRPINTKKHDVGCFFEFGIHYQLAMRNCLVGTYESFACIIRHNNVQHR